jgi:hypothetical protein
MHIHESRPPPRAAWKRIVFGVMAAVLLLPIPAVAITFLNSWDVRQNQSGGAPSATVSSTDTPDGGSLTIGMRAYSAPRVATSTVDAVRRFRVNNKKEMVSLVRRFNTYIQNADLRVSVRFRRLTGSTNWNLPDVQASRYAEFSRASFWINYNQTDSKLMSGGTYEVSITVRQHKNATGAWNNATPYRFTFSSL